MSCMLPRSRTLSSSGGPARGAHDRILRREVPRNTAAPSGRPIRSAGGRARGAGAPCFPEGRRRGSRFARGRCAELDEFAVDRTRRGRHRSARGRAAAGRSPGHRLVEGVLLVSSSGTGSSWIGPLSRSSVPADGSRQCGRPIPGGLQEHDPPLLQDRDGGVPALAARRTRGDPILVLPVELTESTSRPPGLDGMTHRLVVHMEGGVKSPPIGDLDSATIAAGSVGRGSPSRHARGGGGRCGLAYRSEGPGVSDPPARPRCRRHPARSGPLPGIPCPSR